MSNFWDVQKQVAIADMADDAAAIANQWRQKKAQKEFDERTRRAYLLALEEGKKTGDMPVEHQGTVPFDRMASQVGIKVVALRELKKTEPKHPLVVSKECRADVARITRILFNRDGRPDDANLEDYAPDETVSQRIFAHRKE